MDNDQLAGIISGIRILKHKYIGSFPADMIPEVLPPDSFFICNTESSKRPGSHWVMVSKKDGFVYIGDSLGRDPPMFCRKIALKPFKALKLLNRVQLRKETFVWPILYIFSRFRCSQTFTCTMSKLTLSEVFLLRHSRMYIYVTMKNFVCLF